MKEYKNEFVSVEVQTNSTGIYTVQTYDNINSVYIYNNTLTVNIGINSPDYLASTYYIKPGEFYVIQGNTNEILNAPIVLYGDNVGISPNQSYTVIIKRYI